MKSPLSWVAAGLVGVVALGASTALLPGSTVLRDVYRVVLGEPSRAAALDSRSAEVRRCEEAKQEIALAVVEGRLTPAEAAARFERLEAEMGIAPVVGREPVAKRVMQRVAGVLRDRPAPERRRVLSRLGVASGADTVN